MSDKSVKNRTWSGAFPKLERPSGKTILDEANKDKKDKGALTGAFPTMRKPSIKKILKGKN